MAKKPSPLPNRLARHRADRRSGVVAAVLRPADADRSLFEVAWDVLNRASPLEVTDLAGLAECLTGQPAFTSAQAAGWVAGILGGSLAYESATDPLADPKLVALEADVVAALGPDAVWHANGDHPLPAFHDARLGGGWSPVIRATFDRVVVARGNGLDLVLARADED
jgi:hypothetical protein